MSLKKYYFYFLSFFPILAYGDAEVVTKHALKGCSALSQYHLSITTNSLKKFDILMRAVQSNQFTQKEAKDLWYESIESVSDELYKFIEKMQKVVSARSESTKLMFEIRAAALDFALFQTINDLSGKDFNETRVNRIFTSACEAKVMDLTENYRINQQNRRTEMDRKLNQMERESVENSQRSDIERSQILINQGLAIINQNNSRTVQPSGCFFQRETISGFHKTCYYGCVTGNITHIVGAAEMCSLTR